MRHRFQSKHFLRLGVATLFIISSVLTALVVFVKESDAAGFSMQTGYYVGNGNSGRVISGLGFQPDLVIIKSANTTEGMFKTSAMGITEASFLSATAINNTGQIIFNSDGFSLGTTVNAGNILYTWTAFSGSDCSASGNFCVGSYTGNGGGVRTITTGFQPSLVINKQSSAAGAHFRTASLVANRSAYFVVTADNLSGAFLRDFSSTGFSVGATDNASAGTYHYVAFKATAGVMSEGLFVGDGLDNRSITGVGFKPDLVIAKNLNSSVSSNNRRTVMTNDQQTTDKSSYLGNTVADAVDAIQRLEPDGFQVGTLANVNESTRDIVWFAFGGVPTPTGNGTYKMAVGSYTGTGGVNAITGLGFSPDLVVIKGNSSNYKVFRTKMMKGDSTTYLAVSTGAFSSGITSLDTDGFSLGTSAITNASGVSFQWQAFGNAYNPETKTGAADFAIGSYMSTNVDGTVVGNLPFQPDFLLTRGGSNIAGYKTSTQPSNSSGFFSSGGEVTNAITAFTADGFQLGVNSSSNVAGVIRYDWFAFKNGANFTVGDYVGNSTNNRDVTLGSGIQPDLVWIKRASGSDGVSRPSTLTGSANTVFVNTANGTGIILGLTSTGMTISTNFQVNSSGETYRYMVWRIPPSTGTLNGDIVDSGGTSVVSPSISMSALNYPFECSQSVGVLGSTNQKIRINNATSTASWTTSIAATDGTTALWRNGGNTNQYDYNESGGSPAGCSDGSDTDSHPGVLRIQPSSATITPQVGCASTNITLGNDTNFNESTTNAITLASASSGAQTGCYWDITGIDLRQYVPLGQPSDTYTLDLTITTTSS